MTKTCTLDIESSCLLSDAIDYSSLPYKIKPDVNLWCVVITDVDTLTPETFVGNEITYNNLEECLKKYDVIVAHNGIKFDFIKLKLFGVLDYEIGFLGEDDTLFGRSVKFIDTLILSRLINPDRFGGHGLGAWGKRVGRFKIDYRAKLIEIGALSPSDPKGHEFTFFHPLMVEYCIEDTIVNALVYKEILKEYRGNKDWGLAIKQEHKLADLAVRREAFGFWFDKELAFKNIEELTKIMQGIQERVNPILPDKKMTKGELDYYTPPIRQVKADGTLTSYMTKYLENIGATVKDDLSGFLFEGAEFPIPYDQPVKTHKNATVDDLETVKEYLLELGWEPTEWGERDLSKDAKKQPLSIEKKIKAIERYCQETLAGKYKESRLKEIGIEEDLLEVSLRRDMHGTKPIRVPTAPKIRVGVSKELCPNLVKLGEKVGFAKDVADYYTYRHRKSAISGGDADPEEEVPETGYLSMYREEDGRIPTPAIEIGASTNRYTHIGVANIPRASSIFGKEMRSLFGCGEGFVQFGFDYSSLEARVQGHYVFPYTGGAEMAVALLAEKPHDIHSITSQNLGIQRDDAKSINYMMLYGGSPNKVKKMLGYSIAKAKKFHSDWWDMNPSLKELRDVKEKEWIASGKKWITSIDGRKINIRSKHSIINALFQSTGVIIAKYVTVKLFDKLEKRGFCTDVFKGVPDIAEMISYHDEAQLAVQPYMVYRQMFETEEQAMSFKSGCKEQTGAIQEENGKFFVTLPNILSALLTETIKEVEQMFNMQVEIGYEYVTGKNWYDCH